MFIEHPLLRKDSVEHREFQVNIAKECLSESTLVVLPTGLGKTVVALLVIADVLMKKGGRILFMAPTKPLVDQHAAFLRKNLLIESVSTFTGEMPPDRRVNDWKSARIIVSTPQVVENDIDSGTVPLKDFSLLIFDEAHRAVGDYSYVRIGGRYTAENDDPLVLGMTASPGYDLDKVAEVCRNLG
ncbi:MAG: DEAD/DEAH box helicase family protein, partial [Thermoplasmata archaeon]